MDKPNETQSEPTSAVSRFWRTLEEREQSPATRASVEDEFLTETIDDSLPATTLTRRGFLGAIGAAAALATAACTSRDRPIVPYTKRPKEIVPGVANYYASTFSEGQRSYSVLVKTREGRPIHVTGNDEDPRLKGKTSLRAIADVNSLYDPDRLTAPRHDQRAASWSDAEKALLGIFSAANQQNKPVLLLASASSSPTRSALLTRLRAQVPSLDVVYWEPAVGDAARLAAEAVYGVPVHTTTQLDQAQVIVTLGADILNGDEPDAVAAFTAQRKLDQPRATINRLWAIEGSLSLTGANADQRITLRPTQMAGVAFALIDALVTSHGIALPAGVSLPKPPEGFIERQGIAPAVWQHLVNDVASAKSQAVILCGDAMPVEAQVAAHLLNVMLGSRAVRLGRAEPTATMAELNAIVGALDAGKYHAMVFWGTNPAYALAEAKRFAAAVSKVPHRVWIGQSPDETAGLCQWQLPENHWLECWGDFRADSSLMLQQPAIAPLYDTRQGEDILLSVLRGLGATTATDYHAYLVNRWLGEVRPPDSPIAPQRFFEAALHDGVYLGAPLEASPAFVPQHVAKFASAAFAAAGDGEFELLLSSSSQIYDGRYANNGWLQELPDPITKNTWGNPLLVSVEDAKTLGLQNGDVVELVVGDVRLETPILVQPGQAKGVLSLALGYGRTVGTVAKNVGVNAFGLLGQDPSSPNIRRAVRLTKTGKHVRLALTQTHHRMHGRELVKSLTLDEFSREHGQPKKKVSLATLYPDQQFPEHKWGMVIDLAACVGCSACVIACQSENNIATVGPEQVERGREMHWIRIDSYYEGSESNPTVVHQPMLCQHCDSAPCENVCPVNATNHSPDGLNQMAYNRCVGTRYCANNCAYKVRRYNFFDYTSDKKEPADLVYNPEVTVRPRGVMEKCSFCVQRIEDARMRAKSESRGLHDGDIVTACEAACPSGAIVFGDLKQQQSRVAKATLSSRGYKVLEELGTRPAVTYLANLRNPAKTGGANE